MLSNLNLDPVVIAMLEFKFVNKPSNLSQQQRNAFIEGNEDWG